MDFWNDFSKKANDLADKAALGAERIAKITKLNHKISTLRSKLDNCYRDIGQLKYAENCGEKVDDSMYIGLFQQVDSIKKEISVLETRLCELKNCKVCAMCGYNKLTPEMKYCPMCNEKIN